MVSVVNCDNVVYRTMVSVVNIRNTGTVIYGKYIQGRNHRGDKGVNASLWFSEKGKLEDWVLSLVGVIKNEHFFRLKTRKYMLRAGLLLRFKH